MNRRTQNIIFFTLMAIWAASLGYAVYATFIASDDFYEDCSNCYKDNHKRHWNMDKDKNKE